MRDIHSDNVGTAVVSGKEKKSSVHAPGELSRESGSPAILGVSQKHKCLAQYELLETNRKWRNILWIFQDEFFIDWIVQAGKWYNTDTKALV